MFTFDQTAVGDGSGSAKLYRQEKSICINSSVVDLNPIFLQFLKFSLETKLKEIFFNCVKVGTGSVVFDS